MRRGLPTGSVAAILLAGCLQGAPDLGPTAGDASELVDGLLAAPVQLVGPGADAEASIDVSEDGQTILLCTHGGFTQASPLWASIDGGRSFRRIRPQPNQDFDGDCDVAIAGDGSWYIVYDTIASATVAASHDLGQTWSVTFLNAIPLGGVDRPWIEAAERVVYMSYQNVAALEPAINVVAVSVDRGRTWIPHVISHAEPPERLLTIGGDPFLSDEGQTIRIVLGHQGVDGRKSLELAVSRDGAQSWVKLPVRAGMDAMGGIPTAARAGDGTLYIAYSTPRDDVGDVVVLTSHDDGATWSDPWVVAGSQAFSGLPTVWLDARPDGSATLVWMTRNGSATWQPMVARIHDAPQRVVDALGPLGDPGQPTDLYEFSMVRHDAAGRAHFVYPLVTGPHCKETPTLPSQVGSGDVPRNNQCLFYAREAPDGGMA